MRKKRVSISVFQIFIALIIIIALIIGIIVVKKNVVSTGEINTKKMGDFAGSGTSQEPYKIEKIEDIVKLSENVKSIGDEAFTVNNELTMWIENPECIIGKYAIRGGAVVYGKENSTAQAYADDVENNSVLFNPVTLNDIGTYNFKLKYNNDTSFFLESEKSG